MERVGCEKKMQGKCLLQKKNLKEEKGQKCATLPDKVFELQRYLDENKKN